MNIIKIVLLRKLPSDDGLENSIERESFYGILTAMYRESLCGILANVLDYIKWVQSLAYWVTWWTIVSERGAVSVASWLMWWTIVSGGKSLWHTG